MIRRSKLRSLPRPNHQDVLDFNSLCVGGLLISAVCAVPQNTTIDDTDPRLNYDSQFLEKCTVKKPCDTEGLDPHQLFNSTMTSADGSVTFNFTGTAIYIFFVPNNGLLQCSFRVDGARNDNDFDSFPSPSGGAGAGYNTLAFKSTLLKPGPHFFNMTAEQGEMHFDYAIVTSDPDAESAAGVSAAGSSSASSMSTSAISTSSSTSPTSQIPSPSSSNARTKLAAGAVAGISIGAAAAFGIMCAAVWCCLSDRYRVNGDSSSRPPTLSQAESRADETTALAAEIRMVRSQVERLEVRQSAVRHDSVGGSSLMSDVGGSLPRSLSTMKRDQSRVLRDTYSTATNSMVHTDSGLRLAAGTLGEEVPPEYAPD
ncbi:hypothetical protein B0H10DRAFT_2085710 [Mycena sp. CBHHK59/15]|nr:hypothetical protein B0H10DRAFT_2085710 [Mycena sp. CBHHK59/15]